MKKPTKIVLLNGLTLWVDYRPEAKHQHMVFIINAGSYEGSLGEMHLLEHLVGRNSPNLNEKQIKNYFYNNGGEAMLGATDTVHTEYSFRIPCKKELIESGLRIFSSFLLGARITSGLKHERSIIQNVEFAEYHGIRKVLEREMDLSEALCGDRWYGSIRTLGTPEELDSITLQNLQSSYDRFYVPQNMDIFISGGLSCPESKRLLEQSVFSQKREGCRNIRPAPPNTAPVPSKILLEESMTALGTSSNSTRWTLSWMIHKRISYEIMCLARNMIQTRLNRRFRDELGITYAPEVEYGECIPYNIFKIEILTSPQTPDMYKQIHLEVDKALSSPFLFRKEKEIRCRSYKYNDHMSQEDWNKYYIDSITELGRVETFEDRLEMFKPIKFKDMNIVRELLSPERGVAQVWHP